MFGLMKTLVKEKEPAPEPVAVPEKIPPTDLHAGCTVGFGFMPQKNISGRRLPVKDVSTYLFDEDQFLAYRLEGEGTNVNLILADEEEEAGVYLALSQRLDSGLFAALFGVAPAAWFDLNEGDAVSVFADAPGAPQGWLAARYNLAVTTPGKMLKGDFRLQSPSARENDARGFSYALLLDEANEHALEVEKYEDGTFYVFATVYRPATDIGEIVRPLAPPLVAVVSSVEPAAKTESMNAPVQPAPPEPFAKAPSPEGISQEPKRSAEVIAMPEVHSAAAPPSVAPAVAASPTVAAPAVVLAAGAEPAAATHTTPASVGDMLACSTVLAGHIIVEAQRNQMSLSDLIRKVIDLPARIREQILIPFSLSDAEYAVLARRYQVTPSDHEAIRRQILIELQQFIGTKKV